MGREGHGPEPIEDDPWDAAQVGDSERYQGRRRASPAGRRWLIVTVALGVLAAAVGAALTWTSGGTPSGPPASAADARSSKLPGDPGSLSPSSTPTVSVVSPVATSPRVQTTAAIPQFDPITIEAEAGSPRVSLSGSAQVEVDPAASGGRMVGKLGAWGDGQNPGVLSVNGVRIPTTGVYRISIYYTNADKPGLSSGTVSVSGAPPATIKFAGNRSCCGVKEVEITLAAGEHTITISNPNGIAPAVDKITVSRPV